MERHQILIECFSSADSRDGPLPLYLNFITVCKITLKFQILLKIYSSLQTYGHTDQAYRQMCLCNFFFLSCKNKCAERGGTVHTHQRGACGHAFNPKEVHEFCTETPLHFMHYKEMLTVL